ncbi:Uncharacterized protein AC501_3318 [Pseudomonas amygdali pv. lachrymans]|nr:Uncharacterized protein AC501_3318 [Pseudomonas amygdali pv. lachrymans]RMM39442.1 hypothetical protein ALQ79_200555 [Pseudomonas amygdali pv. lachrymans]
MKAPALPSQPLALAGFVRSHLEELDGPALDWAVAQAACVNVEIVPSQYQTAVRASNYLAGVLPLLSKQ